jgi:hypothetical protein
MKSCDIEHDGASIIRMPGLHLGVQVAADSCMKYCFEGVFPLHVVKAAN